MKMPIIIKELHYVHYDHLALITVYVMWGLVNFLTYYYDKTQRWNQLITVQYYLPMGKMIEIVLFVWNLLIEAKTMSLNISTHRRTIHKSCLHFLQIFRPPPLPFITHKPHFHRTPYSLHSGRYLWIHHFFQWGVFLKNLRQSFFPLKCWACCYLCC